MRVTPYLGGVPIGQWHGGPHSHADRALAHLVDAVGYELFPGELGSVILTPPARRTTECCCNRTAGDLARADRRDGYVSSIGS
jgi:hypothetical protein